MAGRPSLLTDEVKERFLYAIRHGNYIEVACDYAGIGKRTWYSWVTRAEMDEEPYATFVQEVRAAETCAEIEAVKKIIEIGLTDDVRSLQWWLARKYPDRWVDRSRVGIDGNEVKQTITLHVVYDDPGFTEEDHAETSSPSPD